MTSNEIIVVSFRRPLAVCVTRAAASTLSPTSVANAEWSNAKPFETMPSPKGINFSNSKD